MRISPVLLLLSVLVLTGSAAIANDDRPASPQPAIVSPVAAPLTIESLAGTYKATVNEQELTNFLRALKKQEQGGDEKRLDTFLRQVIDRMTITINADGTFESEFTLENSRGNVKLDGNKLSFIADPTEHIEDADGAAKAQTFLLVVSANRKKLLIYYPKGVFKIIREYVKQ